MKEERIQRMNALYHKHKEGSITKAEETEWLGLKREYIDSFKANLRKQLDNAYVIDDKGNKVKLERKAGK